MEVARSGLWDPAHAHVFCLVMQSFKEERCAQPRPQDFTVRKREGKGKSYRDEVALRDVRDTRTVARRPHNQGPLFSFINEKREDSRNKAGALLTSFSGLLPFSQCSPVKPEVHKQRYFLLVKPV